MAYDSGTALGGKGILDAVASFMTTNGWALLDSMGEHDKVFRSEGASGKQNHVIRLTLEARLLDFDNETANFTIGQKVTGAQSGATGRIATLTDNGSTGTLGLIDIVGRFQNDEIVSDAAGGSATVNGKLRFPTWKDPTNSHNAFDWILVRGYTRWDAASHTGVNEFGRWGPWIGFTPGTTTGSWSYARRDMINDPSSTKFWEVGATFPTTSSGSLTAWDQHRFMFSAPVSNQFYLYDFASNSRITGGTNNYSYGPFNLESAPGPLVGDKAADASLLYSWQDTSTAASAIKRWNSTTDSWESISSIAGFLGTQPDDVCPGAWDGEDHIYFVGSYNQSAAAKYQISTNTWTALASPPSSSSSLGDPFNGTCAIYLPVGSVSGINEDIILFNRRPGTSLDRYNVGSNTWSTVTLPEALNDSSSLVWDSEDNKLYYSVHNSAHGYVADLNTGLSFSRSVQLKPSAYSVHHKAVMFDHYVSKLRVRGEDSIQYKIVGDADTITIVSTLSSGRSYWVQFGLSDSQYGSDVASLSAGVTPDAVVTVSVDDTSFMEAGQNLMILNPETGDAELISVLSVASSTTFTSVFKKSYPVGSRVFVDGANTVVTGDSWQAAYAYDAGGVRSDKIGSTYKIAPITSNDVMSRSSPSIRGRVQLWSYLVFANVENLKTFENRSKLRNVYAIGDSADAPNVGDIITDKDGNQYVVVNSEFNRLSADVRRMVIGPIN